MNTTKFWQPKVMVSVLISLIITGWLTAAVETAESEKNEAEAVNKTAISNVQTLNHGGSVISVTLYLDPDDSILAVTKK